MANLLQAVNAYGPKIEMNKTAGLKETANWIAMRTSMNASEASAMLQELSACLLFFNNQGTPVKLPGIGRVNVHEWREGLVEEHEEEDAAATSGEMTSS